MIYNLQILFSQILSEKHKKLYVNGKSNSSTGIKANTSSTQ